MVTPFVPVPVPMEGTPSGSCWARPNNTSPLDSLSGSTPGRSPWVKGTGAWASTVVGPRLPQACPSPDAYKGVVSFSDPGTPGDSWARPLTPTLLGYEVMEERAKFTVYKVLVRRNPEENWVIFRRYTDFSRLNDKLKELFPRFRLALPPKRWFRDNYDVEFLEERQLGLQAFLQNLIAHKDITNRQDTMKERTSHVTFQATQWEYTLPVKSLDAPTHSSEAVRQFLCLDDPPGPFDSLEESRAFCETLEETNHRLQRELLDKQRQIDSLKTALDERQTRIEILEKILNGEVPFPEGRTMNSGTLSTLDRENRADTDTATAHGETEDSDTVSSTMGADQDTCPETSLEVDRQVKGYGVYWSTSTMRSSADVFIDSATS